MIDRSTISRADAEALDDYRDRSESRRARNQAAGLCINENVRGTHGVATHGVRCERCYLVHKGAKVEPLPRKPLCQCANCQRARRGKQRIEHAPPRFDVSARAAAELGPDPDATINRWLDAELARN